MVSKNVRSATRAVLSALGRGWRLGWRWSLRILLLLILADIGYLYSLWPDWQDYAAGEIKRSAFIESYQARRRADDRLPRLRWSPVPISRISREMQRSVVVAEDSRFYEHGGFDFEAFKEAMQTNLEKGRLAYGASTISQQTVKNLFLSASRDPLRKWHELWLTFGMEHNLDKQRILELYLNIAEFGRGLYGVEAAAQYYYGIPASRLLRWQAIELAATLPSPVKNNPETRSTAFQRRVRRISRYY